MEFLRLANLRSGDRPNYRLQSDQRKVLMYLLIKKSQFICLTNYNVSWILWNEVEGFFVQARSAIKISLL